MTSRLYIITSVYCSAGCYFDHCTKPQLWTNTPPLWLTWSHARTHARTRSRLHSVRINALSSTHLRFTGAALQSNLQRLLLAMSYQCSREGGGVFLHHQGGLVQSCHQSDLTNDGGELFSSTNHLYE